MCQLIYFFWDPPRKRAIWTPNIQNCFSSVTTRVFNTATNRCPGYRPTDCIYSETIYTGSTRHAYTKDSTGIETITVHVTLTFDYVSATPTGIRVKYPDINIAQETYSSLLKIPFLPVKALHSHLFDTIESGLLLSLGKQCDSGCINYFNV